VYTPVLDNRTRNTDHVFVASEAGEALERCCRTYRFKGTQLYKWDMRKPFQAACDRAGINRLRIHDLRHTATRSLFLQGIPDAIIRQLTGHRSRELERYEHRSPLLKQQTVGIIAKKLSPDTATDTPESGAMKESSEVTERIGGDDGVRTRDLRRDRPAF
jgi:integrase